MGDLHTHACPVCYQHRDCDDGDCCVHWNDGLEDRRGVPRGDVVECDACGPQPLDPAIESARLRAENATLLARAEEAERERDAAREGQEAAPTIATLRTEIARLADLAEVHRVLCDVVTRERDALIAARDTPEVLNFVQGVTLEVQHQREKWPEGHDATKSDDDWFWLFGYLAGKALASAREGDTVKTRHHTITAAAALANWHAKASRVATRRAVDHVKRALGER